MAKTLIVIVGPTAIGKTSLAIELARYYHTEIISADSRQFYREMEIGTAKPSKEELGSAKHHFINSHSVKDNFSVGDYEREASDLLTKLFKKNDIAIAVGGSGLFINAIINGFDDIPASSAGIRDTLNQMFRQDGIKSLQEKLKSVDPAYYQEVDIYNPQRLIRAIEVFETTGKPFSEYRNRIKKQRPFNIIQVGLNTDRQKLYENINTRVDIMIENGLIKEVEELSQFRHLNPLNSVGYTEIFNYLEGNSSLKDAIEKIKQNTRRFAKRQLTWFNRSEKIEWFKPEEFENIIKYLEGQLHCPEHVEQRS